MMPESMKRQIVELLCWIIGVAILISIGVKLDGSEIGNVSWNIIGGIISGFLVYFIIEYRDNRQWQKSKNKLIKLLDNALIRTLTTVRLASGIEASHGVQMSGQLIKFIKQEFGDDCKNVESKMKTDLNAKRLTILLKNVQGLQEETKYLLSIFLSFKKVDSWYVDKIIALHNHLANDFWIYYAFPEIGNSEYEKDKTIMQLKSDGAKQISLFCKFVLDFKCSKEMNIDR